MLGRGIICNIIAFEGALHGLLAYGFFGRIEDIRGRAAGSLGCGGGAVQGSEENGSVDDFRVCAGGEGGDARGCYVGEGA
jgi:hypothetical protein